MNQVKNSLEHLKMCIYNKNPPLYFSTKNVMLAEFNKFSLQESITIKGVSEV